MLGGFFTADNRNLTLDSILTFLIYLLAPCAQPLVDKLNSCQEMQLESTCCYSAAYAKSYGDVHFWK